ncbi:MAG TPA: hypothetical protein DCX49_06080, partial [Flavobacteriales bacterium]|nr:hypothetical protein [Flavobacteriales bacterium]
MVDGDMPLPNVTIRVKGTFDVSATDFDGKFNMAVQPGATLVFSYIGYLEQELVVASTASDLKVVMKPDVA